MSFKPFEADFKVVIFWLPEKMNPAAANKLLKLIEEPADFTVFLFVSEQPDLILPTILSRTQPVKVPGISNEALKARLAYDFPDAGAELETVTRIARGDYLKARDRLTHREQDVYFREKLIEWLRMAYGLKVLELRGWIDEISDLVREKQKAFLIYAIRTLRGNFMLNRGLDELVAFDPEEQAFSLRFRRFIHEGNIRLLYEELSLAITQISLNANSRILFTDLSLKLHELLKIPAQE
ncbi:MAG: DNA polymerase III subunit delta, partial [Bacteroidales bacterium]|nr:DNA polymerase III subunit delta [Bacteroidales bacterium]